MELRISTDDDLVKESNGEILVSIAPGEEYEVANEPSNSATIAVRDNDNIEISLAVENSKIFEGQQIDFLLSASKILESDLIVSLQTVLSGDFGYEFVPTVDFAESIIQLTIPADQQNLQFQLDTVDDLILEPFGTATIALMPRFRIFGGSISESSRN